MSVLTAARSSCRARPRRPTTRGSVVPIDSFDPETDNERIFDEVISPILEALVDACVEHGLPFVGAIQFSHTGIARSFVLHPRASQRLFAAGYALSPDEFELEYPKKEDAN